MAKVVKPANGKSVAQIRKEKAGSTMHGSEPNRKLHKAQGKLMRMDEKPRTPRMRRR